jgi:ABC-type phosphate transport system permease subunit
MINTGKINSTTSRFRMIPAIGLASCAFGLILGCITLFINTPIALSIISLAGMTITLTWLLFWARKEYGSWKAKFIFLACFSLISLILLFILPEYFYGLQINGIFHRSLVAALILIAVSLPSIAYSLYYLLGGTPTASDYAKYPLILFPATLALMAYGLLLTRLFIDGIPQLDWNIITQPFQWQHWKELVYQNDWPMWVDRSAEQAGMLNHILGTLLLIGMTITISLPIGLGAGLFLSEYSHGWYAGTVKFITTLLRAVSPIVIGLTAFSLACNALNSGWAYILAGYYYDNNGTLLYGNGSYLLAAVMLSLLVIPGIARSTEEGCRSLPGDQREGSLALGTSQTHTLKHIVLPWAMPNIVTGVLLGCAEAAGSVAIIMLIAGTGEFGVNPLNEVTSLSYFIFETQFGPLRFTNLTGDYRFGAAVILILITLGLSIAALILKRNLSRRYRGQK